MIVLLTGCSLALSLGVAIAFGEPALHRPHIALALGFGGVFGAAALLFVLATIGDKHLWVASLNVIAAKLLGAHRSDLGVTTVVGRTAVVVSAFARSADGHVFGQVRLGAEIWTAQLESLSSPLPTPGASVKIVAMRGLTAIVKA